MAEAGASGDSFFTDLLRFGSLRCFRHFSVSLRGREELSVTVPGCDLTRVDARLASSPTAESHTEEMRAVDRHAGVSASFLLAAYARYGAAPYVWLRSSSELDAPERANLPLELRTTQHWREHEYRVFDIVEELVLTVASPAPANVFAVDHQALSELPAGERALMSGALVHFLGLDVGTPKVQNDVAALVAAHFSAAESVHLA